MGLQDLAPENTQRAQKTAINAIERFLTSEDVNMGFIAACLLNDQGGSACVKLMDRFGAYLDFVDGRAGKPLARNSVMSYYRHAKNWLHDSYPKHRAAIEKKLLKMAQTLERYCLKRSEGGAVKKAPACTKEDLRILMDGIYYDAASSKDYQDAAVLALMWYTFGRALTLGFVAKSSLSVSAEGVIFVRLIRVKTSEEQAMALVMQDFPSSQVLEHPRLFDGSAVNLAAPDDVPLVEALACCSLSTALDDSDDDEIRKPKSSLKIHGYVNRVVKAATKAQGRAKPTPNLSSHSFRRGGAQHANSDPSLCAQWIFDRGSWNMTTTNKAFAYVFNTTSEAQKVSRVLSG
ncbi:hypothetical protein PR003_g2889 [Phytophthora rubi]|uniref:Uncharacterized protein n=1 Tax=Phytophthora rubi TaxID=129364 RepID=A0A6A4G558_9STRA|nr:hypothetical protein PR003_g2889 [Phytophthora rubi]